MFLIRASSATLVVAEQNINLENKVQGQEERVESLTDEIEVLKADRDLVRKRIVVLLEKIEAFNS